MPKKGPSKNLSRLNEDIRRTLVEIIREMKDPRLKEGLLTITRVETDTNLSSCKVYVSVLEEQTGADNQSKDAKGKTQGAMAALERAKGHVRSEVSSRMHIRRAPEFVFIADENAAYAAHMNQLLGKL